ncbi:MAG: MATE family efflux transporter [Bacteroides sp.]|nr:MATE family efflux transporter [Roseburia sp.]MCM1345730.1 MATE family efflux transporter [Bacteroides sp.]MCM1419831.1 MATE family efflux transporter [Bacteroides sp.]
MISYKSHIRSLVALGIPIVIGQLGNIAQAFADTIMVGQYGTYELSAAGFTNNVFNLVIFFLLGFSYSTTPIVGSHFGRGQYAEAARTLKESLVMNLLVCAGIVAFMSVLYLNLHRLGQPEEILPLIRSYFLVILASLPFMSAFNSLKQFCDAVGDTRTPMWVMIGGNMVNIVGNYLLIFGTFGFPELGLVGAGVATLSSRIVMAIVLALIVLFTRKYSTYRNGLRLAMTRRGMMHLSKVGLPISLQMSMETGSFNVCAVMMGWLGTAALAAHQIMCTVGSLCFMVYYGIGAAAAVRISHFRGRGEWAEVRRAAYVAFGLTLFSGVILASAIYIFRMPLTCAFTTSGEVVATVMPIIIPLMLYQLGDSMQTVFANSLRAIEDVKMMMLYAFIAYIVVSIPLSYLFAFPMGGGSAGIWYGFPFGLTTAGILFFMRFDKQTRKIMNGNR